MKRLEVTVVGLLIALSQAIYSSAPEILLNIKHLPQVDAANGIGLYQINDKGQKIEDWGPTKICGPVSLIIEAAHLKGFVPTSQDIKDLIDWMVIKKFKLDEVNDYGQGANNYYGYKTISYQLIQIAKEYYGISDVGWHSKYIKKPDDSIDAEKTHVREDELISMIALSLTGNRPVVVDTQIDMNSTKPGHFLVVDGLRDVNNDGDYTDDNDQLHVTDPGHSKSNPLYQTWYKISQLRSTWSGVLIIGENINSPPTAHYTYDGNGYTGYGPQTGGESTGWNYSLPRKTATFYQGDLVYGMVNIDNVSVDFRWLAHFYRNGTYSHTQYWDKNIVGQWVLQHSYFWPQLWNASSGEWEARVFLENSGKEDPICTLKFSVVKPANWQPYNYDGNGYTGYGPQTGDEKTDWKFSLPQKTAVFNQGDLVYGLVYVDNLSVDHRWLAHFYRNGAYSHTQYWDKYLVGSWVLQHSYFWPQLWNASLGEWEMRVFLENQGKEDYICTLKFTVVRPANWQPYTRGDKVCTGYGPQIGGIDTGWTYVLPRETAVFNQGDHIYGLVYVKNISVNHRWLVRFYRNGIYFDIQRWEINQVGQWIWQYSYFWPELWNAPIGSWEMRVFLENQGKEDYICTLPFTVVKPANWQPYDDYDGNGYTGYGPQIGGADTDWNYTLPQRTAIFNEGDHVYGLVRFDNIAIDHRFHLAAFRDNAFAYNYTWAWNYLNGYRWKTAYFWPELDNAPPGNWRFEIYLEYDGKVDAIGKLYFTVNSRNNPAPPPVKPGIRFDFNAHNPMGWKIGFDTSYIVQNQADYDTWMVAAQGPNPGVVSPELPPEFSASRTPELRFSVMIRGPVRGTLGQIWLMDNNGFWGYETRFPVMVDYEYHEYAINLSHLGNIPIRRFSIELTQKAPYEQWIFDWLELK